MCRVVIYMGKPLRLDTLIFECDSALVNQVHDPQKLNMLNLAGFGMLAWDELDNQTQLPWQYRSTQLPMFDHNLRHLSKKISCEKLLAHIRGVPLNAKTSICDQNLHPFLFSHASLALAHNGDLYDFNRMRYALIPYIKKIFLSQIRGNTDSEWIYALFLSCFKDAQAQHGSDQIHLAAQEMIDILRKIRKQFDIDISSSLNLFVCNSNCVVAIRYTFDYGCYPQENQQAVHQGGIDYLSLWYTLGEEYAFDGQEWKMLGGSDTPQSIIMASEPLSHDTSTWVKVPEYHLLAANKSTTGINTQLYMLE